MKNEDMRETVQRIEELVGQLKVALNKRESENKGAKVMCQSDSFLIPDWP